MQVPQIMNNLSSAPASQLPSAFQNLLQTYYPKVSPQLFDQAPTRESLMLLHQLMDRTETVQKFLPHLQALLQQSPQETAARLPQLLAPLQQAVEQGGKMPTANQMAMVQDLVLALQGKITPHALSQQLQTLLQNSNTPATTRFESLLQTHYPGLQPQNFPGQISRESLLILHQLLERTHTLNQVLPQLQEGLKTQPQDLLRQLIKLNPFIQQALNQQSGDAPLSFKNPGQFTQALQQFLQNGGELKNLQKALQTLTPRTASAGTASTATSPPSSAGVLNPSTPATAPQGTVLPGSPAPLANTAMPAYQVVRPASLDQKIPVAESSFLRQNYPGISLRNFADAPEARLSLLLLHQLGERTQTLNQMIPRLTELLRAAPKQTIDNLSKQLPQLQQMLTQLADAGVKTQATEVKQFVQTVLNQLPQTAQSASAQTAQVSPPSSPLNPGQVSTALEGTLQRFYSSLPPAAQQSLSQQIQGAPQNTQQGFSALHQFLSQIDLKPNQLQQIQAAMQLGAEINPRLAQLQAMLQPILTHLTLNPHKAALLSNTLQARVIQTLVQFIQTGNNEALKGALTKLIGENVAHRNPLNLVQARFQQFGLQINDLPLMQHIWHLSQGSRDRIDAMALLMKGDFPLLPKNIQTVLQYIQNLPTQTRFQSIGQILKFLSPQLVALIDQQLKEGKLAPQFNNAPISQEVSQNFGTLKAFIQYQIPGLSQNWNQVMGMLPTQPMPLLEMGGTLEQLIGLLKQIPEAKMPPWLHALQEYMHGLINQLGDIRAALANPVTGEKQIQQLMTQLQELFTAMKGKFEALEQKLLPHMPLQPTTGEWMPRLPLQLQAVLQHLMGQASAQMLPPTQTQTLTQMLSMLVQQMQQAAPEMQQLANQLGIMTLAKEALPKGALPILPPPLPEANLQALAQMTTLPQETDALKAYFNQLGLQIQDPQMLAHIQQLMNGSQDRLDAIGILLKGNMALIPAHIQVVANYVKQIPPHERFRSISKILMYLSDSLIAHMKKELKGQPKKAGFSELMQNKGYVLNEKGEATSEKMMRQFKPQVSHQTLEAARYLMQSPLPKTGENLARVQQLLTSPLTPQSLFQGVIDTLAQIQSLLQYAGLPQQMAGSLSAAQQYLSLLLGYFKELKQMLEPGQGNLGNWMMGLMAKIKDKETAFYERLAQAQNALGEAGFSKTSAKGWLSQIESYLGQILAWLAEAQGESETTEQLKQLVRQHIQHLRGQLENMHLFMQQDPMGMAALGYEAAPQANHPPAQQVILPIQLEGQHYPVEVSVQEQPESEGGEGSGQKSLVINLSVTTHSMGTMVFTFQTKPEKLQIKIGVENRDIQDFVHPYLESLMQKLSDYPWETLPIQNYVVPKAFKGQNMIARQIQTRYRYRRIDSI